MLNYEKRYFIIGLLENGSANYIGECEDKESCQNTIQIAIDYQVKNKDKSNYYAFKVFYGIEIPVKDKKNNIIFVDWERSKK